MIQNEPDKNLERLLHQRLRALPELRAPKELVPRVLEKIAAQKALHWWNRSWFEWPRGLQIASAVLFAILLGSIGWFHSDIWEAVNRQAGGMAATLRFLKPLATVVEALAGVLQLLVNSIKPEFSIIAAIVVVGLYASAVGLGTLFYRVATGRK